MTRGRMIAVAIAVAVAVGVGTLVGDVNQSCEHSCPGRGLCPTPPGCNAGFYWPPALVAGAITFVIVLAVSLAAASAFRFDD